MLTLLLHQNLQIITICATFEDGPASQVQTTLTNALQKSIHELGSNISDELNMAEIPEIRLK